MAKGRRLTSERLLAAPEYTTSHVTPADLPDLAEDEVWSLASPGPNTAEFYRTEQPPVHSNRLHNRTGPTRPVGGLTLAFEETYDNYDVPVRRPAVVHQYRNLDHRQGPLAASSAPVNVPVWPSFFQFGPTEPVHDRTGLSERDDNEDEDIAWMPPHEYLARQNGMTKGAGMVTSSVFEGVGRTLKGRDMSRVRDAVWNQTGFFG